MPTAHSPLKSTVRVVSALAVAVLAAWAYGQYSDERAFRANNPHSLAFCSQLKPGTIPSRLRELASLGGADSAQLANGNVVVKFPNEQACVVEFSGGAAGKAYVPRQD
jgi:hypothetical protein